MPAKSQAQRARLNMKFGHAWVKAHHFDNPGKLPGHVSNKPAKGRAPSHSTRYEHNPDGSVHSPNPYVPQGPIGDVTGAVPRVPPPMAFNGNMIGGGLSPNRQPPSPMRMKNPALGGPDGGSVQVKSYARRAPQRRKLMM